MVKGISGWMLSQPIGNEIILDKMANDRIAIRFVLSLCLVAKAVVQEQTIFANLWLLVLVKKSSLVLVVVPRFSVVAASLCHVSRF